MRKRILVLSLTMGLAVTSLAAPAQASDHDRQPTRSGVFQLEDFSDVDGARAFLHRRDDRIRLDLKTYADPGSAYTIWLISFNNPAACTHGEGDLSCGPGDDGPGPAGFSVAWGAGGVADAATGELHLKTGWIDEGTAPGQVLFPFGPFGDEEDVLTDAEAVEIHVIVRSHGPASSDPDVLHAQTHYVVGGCEAGNPEVPPGDPVGEGDCGDQQIALLAAGD